MNEALRVAAKLTPEKVANYLKVWSSYHLSRLTGRERLWGDPASLALEPTTQCNLHCPECPSGLRLFSRHTGKIDFELYKSIIDQTHRKLIYLILYFQGEPYLHPRFLDLVGYASQKGVYTATSTNAHFLTNKAARRTVESGLDRLIISIDGTTQESYQAYRVGGQLDKVLEGARNVVRWRQELKSKTPYLIFQFLVVRQNEHQLPEVRRLAREIGIDKVLVKTAQIYDFEDGSPLMPENPKYSRYERGPDGKFRIKNKMPNHCWRMWHSAVVTWDGGVVPCCFDKDAQHKMGQLGTSTLAQVWDDQAYHRFRQQILQSRQQVDMCRNCTEGMKVSFEL